MGKVNKKQLTAEVFPKEAQAASWHSVHKHLTVPICDFLKCFTDFETRPIKAELE